MARKHVPAPPRCPQNGPASAATAAAAVDGRANADRLAAFIARLPKAELHVHVEGTLEPGMMFELAERNGVELPWPDPAAAAAARAQYTCLEDFLAAYYAGMSVLRTTRDYKQLADAYLARAAAQGVRHAEVFFDPQAHLERGVPFSTFLPGLAAAVQAAPQRHGLTASLIMCFVRHLGPQAAADTLEQALPHLPLICGVGLDSSELGHPPHQYRALFERAAQLGLHRVAHAGEEGPAEYVAEAVSLLGVERVDHGLHCLDDPQLVERLEAMRMPLTVCPLSNLQLQVYKGCLGEKLTQLVRDTRLVITVNSDDPAYFLPPSKAACSGGYVNANYLYLAEVAGLDEAALAELAANSFRASFLGPAAKEAHVAEVAAVLAAWQHENELLCS
ncbi:hypothetical protein ABPG75_013759 [Micractinium tetrahymenae]